MSNTYTNKMEERAKRTKAAAHKRVVKDGTIQFRLDAGNMERLLKLADKRRTGAGVLARMWVLEKLNKELELASPLSGAEQLAQIQMQINSLSQLVQDLVSKQAKAS